VDQQTNGKLIAMHFTYTVFTECLAFNARSLHKLNA